MSAEQWSFNTEIECGQDILREALWCHKNESVAINIMQSRPL